MADTLTYSDPAKGWNSRHSFEPDWMIGLNSKFYTWKNGELYIHHDNATRGSYYGTEYDATITTIFNQDPTEQKMFQTLSLEGDSIWAADIETDLATGVIAADYYVLKEGDYHGYIRRDANTIDPKATSTQGIGEVTNYSAGTGLITFGFTGNEMPSIAVGDKVYLTSDGVTFNLVEAIASYTSTSITVDLPVTTAPTAGNYAVVVKDSTAESFGARGYYMEVELTNTDTTSAELFTVSSQASKSYP